jgi:hypothetical protein
MKKITSFNVDTSEMPAVEVSRRFTVSGEVGAAFLLYVVQNDTIKYYDFIDKAFELGHNNKNNNLEVTMSSSIFNGNIIFPSGGGSYTIKLLASSGTEIIGSNKNIISRSIDKQSADKTITFKAVTANTSNYATFPTTTSSGFLTGQKTFGFNWNITNASTDSHGFGLRLTGDYNEINERHWYFTTTDTVDGAISPADENGGYKVKVDDLTDIGVGSYISAVTTSTLSGTPYVMSIDASTKTLTLSGSQTFADGITLTFIARGTRPIYNAIGSTITFENFPEVSPTTLTKTVRSDVSSSATITLNGTYGIAGGDHVSISGFGVNNDGDNEVQSVSASETAGSCVVQLAQNLPQGTVITFNNVYQVINFQGIISVSNYPSLDKTIYLDIDQLITVGAAT